MITAAPTKERPIAIGSEAPDFTLKDQNDKEFRLSDYIGKKNVILFFYPADWSPTCTSENVCFSQDLSRFAKYGEVAAISADSVWSHKAWAEQLALKHRLLSDVQRAVIQAYGLYVPAANVAARATVVIDRKGKVAFVKVNEDITKERDYGEVSDFLKTLS